MTLSERMVEAAALALCHDDCTQADWPKPTLEQFRDISGYRIYMRRARAALTAALAVAEEAGAGVFVVPEKKGHPGDVERYVYGHADGYNACRADTLAGRVTL